ncbi:MAG: sigma-54-dependent Fis family transcriptional regulator, partial [Deltaproteobacteria bacterium]
DVQMPDGSGLEILPKIKATRSSPEIIVITGLGDPDEAELAIQAGAWDYLEKPASFEAIKLLVLRTLEYRAERDLGKPLIVLKRNGIIGSSQKIASCLELLSQGAGSNVNVLITGETGTGKELFAKAIHSNSSRAHKNFVVVDCTALPETLVESVLFGHARGAFTGADRSEEGLIKQADGGTLFLDEIGELPLLIQNDSSGSSKSTVSVPSEGVRRSRAISGWWRRRTETWKAWFCRDGSGKTCSFDSGRSRLNCPP